MYILKCIVCFKELKPIDKDASDFPYGGTQFHTFGHYGSTFFDPMDGSALEINVCYKCLEASQACNLVKEDSGSIPDGSIPVRKKGESICLRLFGL